MALVGKCPKCEQTLSHIKMTGADVYVRAKREFSGVTFCCPLCQTILSAGIDPFALKSDTIDGVIAAVKKLLRR